MGPERSLPSSSSPKALHNFTMPGGLRWGNQRFLRCMKVNSNGQISAVERRPSTTSSASGSRGDYQTHLLRGGGRSNDALFCSDNSNNKREMGLAFRPEKRLKVGDGGIGIAAVREKVILDLQTAADKMKDAIFRRERFENNSDEPPSPSSEINRDSTAPAVDEGVRPWSLRTRRAAVRLVGSSSGGGVGAATGSGGGGVVNGGGVKNLNMDVLKPNGSALVSSSLRVAGETTPKLRSGAGAAAAPPSAEKKERVKFSVPLTRREIEEDFMAMVGHRPPRRPKKRAKYIQKQLDTLFPGLWLTEITADIYKVPETQ